jgi:endonuclease III
MGATEKKRAIAALSNLRSRRKLKSIPSHGGMMEVLLLALVSQGASLAAARRALDRIRGGIVNWNELRVTQVSDIAGLLRGLRDAQGKAAAIRDVLSSIFEQTHDLEFAFLEGASTAEAKDFLSGLGALTDEIVDEFVLAGRGRFTLVADGDIVRVLRRIGVSGHSEAPAKFQNELEDMAGPDKAYQLMYLAKQLSESICTAHGPKCPECPLCTVCPSARKAKSQ